MSNIQIVFDIGGTKTRIAAVRNDSLDEVEIFNTPADPNEGIRKLVEMAKKAAGDDTISAVCGGVKGRVIGNNSVFKPPHITRWSEVPLGHELKKHLNAPITLFNDTELVGIGEYEYGAGEHSDNMMYLTVSTGVGGALIRNGQIDKGEYTAEIGHQLVGNDTVENQISGPAVKKKYNVEPWELDSIEEREKLAEILAKALYDNVLHWSPDTIVIGGSMIIGKNPIPLDHVEETLTALITTIYPHAPRIAKAKLGNLGGLYGGMAYLKNNS